MKYTNDVLDYYHEDLENVSLDNKSNKELANIIEGLFESDREFQDLYGWMQDNAEHDDANIFHSLFNHGIDDTLTKEQEEMLEKYNFHIFSKTLLALTKELK